MNDPLKAEVSGQPATLVPARRGRIGSPSRGTRRSTGHARGKRQTQIQQGEYQMKQNLMLTIASLLTILFTSFHHADDVVRGMAPGKFTNIIPVLVLLVWLYGTLALAGRRSGYIIILVLSLFVSGIPVIHMTRGGLVGGDIAKSSGAFFFVWTLIALGVSALFSAILSAQGLWSLRRVKSL